MNSRSRRDFSVRNFCHGWPIALQSALPSRARSRTASISRCIPSRPLCTSCWYASSNALAASFWSSLRFSISE
jgi:hypothetical protein